MARSLSLVVCVLTLGSLAAARQTEPLFSGVLSPASGTQPIAGRLGDLDGDGDLDLVARGSNLVELGVFRSNGTGRFVQIGGFADSNGVKAIVLATLDADADLDLALTEAGGSRVRVRFNDGNGAFSTFVDLPLGAAPEGLDAGDLNGDGKVDLAVAVGSDVRVFLGNGLGGFAAPLVYSPGVAAKEVTLAYLDGDANLDLVASAATGNAIFVALGDGLGGFGPRVDHAAGSACRPVVGDLDGDGDADIASGIQALLGDGLGGFVAGATFTVGTINELALGDVDADGLLDLAAAKTSGVVSVLRNLGGTFTSIASLAVDTNARGVALAEVNGDGRLDCVSFVTSRRALGTWLGTADLRFGLAETNLATVAAGLGVSDLDHDGAPDVVSSRNGAGVLEAYFGDGAGSLQPTPVVASFPDASSIFAGDFVPGGGANEFLVGSSLQLYQLTSLRWNGSGFQTLGSVQFQQGPTGVAVADVDDDGAADILLAYAQGFSAPGFLELRRGDGLGGFAPAETLLAPADASSVAAGDLDGDGATDVFGALNSGQVVVLRNDGSGNFLSPQFTSSNASHAPWDLAIGDFDGDHVADVVTANEAQIELFHGSATGPLTPWSVIPTLGGSSEPTRRLRVADVDGDGLTDVLLEPSTLTEFWVGDGTGGFADRQAIGTGATSNALALADFDRDGVRDLVLATGAAGLQGRLRIAHNFRAPQCGQTVYCTAKTNSLGCTPAIGFSGAPSTVATSGFEVFATSLRNQKSSLLFYGTSGPNAVPFQGGTLCVKAPIARTPVTNSGGTATPTNDCTGLASIDFNAFMAANGGLPAIHVAGTTVHCQWWSRDPGLAPPNSTSLSDGLAFTLCH